MTAERNDGAATMPRPTARQRVIEAVASRADPRTRPREGSAWSRLRPFDHVIRGDEQVLIVAATGGAKSTLVATLTLSTPSLVALDEKGELVLPRARVVELPWYGASVTKEGENPDYLMRIRHALAWQDGRQGAPAVNRVILRLHPLDMESFDAHDLIFQGVYERRATILWIDEITATGATPQRVQPWLRACSARGRTRGIGIWTCTQAPFGLTPGVLKRNASYTIVGPLDPEDVRDIPRPSIEIAETIPRKSGRFMVYVAGERDPYRLYMPIPPQLAGWHAP